MGNIFLTLDLDCLLLRGRQEKGGPFQVMMSTADATPRCR